MQSSLIVNLKSLTSPLISPQVATDLVTALKDEIGLPVNLHSHCTSGMTLMSYQAAVDAGVDILDTAISPFSGGTAQPPTESVVAALQSTPYDTGIDCNYGKKMIYIKKR